MNYRQGINGFTACPKNVLGKNRWYKDRWLTGYPQLIAPGKANNNKSLHDLIMNYLSPL
jgi:hypothetical protein